MKLHKSRKYGKIKEKDEKKYYMDEFLGSYHTSFKRESDVCKLYDKPEKDFEPTHDVFSIYDRFSSMIVKGEPSKEHAKVVRNPKILDSMIKSENIVLRTKYFKNSEYAKINCECAKIKGKYIELFENSPFYIISDDKNQKKLYEKTVLLISLREIRDLETYIPVGTS